jgi:hypothetical protein
MDSFAHGQAAASGVASPAPGFLRRHYSVVEVAKLWSLSADFVRRVFEQEPGVVLFGDSKPKRGKRRYRTLRIPEDVLERVHKRLTRV